VLQEEVPERKDVDYSALYSARMEKATRCDRDKDL
jgi:hypothetical protein